MATKATKFDVDVKAEKVYLIPVSYFPTEEDKEEKKNFRGRYDVPLDHIYTLADDIYSHTIVVDGKVTKTGQREPCYVWKDSAKQLHMVEGNSRLDAIRLCNSGYVSPLTGEYHAPLAIPVRCQVTDKGHMLDHQIRAFLGNKQRRDLSVIDQALFIQRMKTSRTLKQIAAEFFPEWKESGPTRVSQTLRLLNLPPAIQERIHDGRMPVSAANKFYGLPEPKMLEVIARIEAELSDDTASIRISENAVNQAIAKLQSEENGLSAMDDPDNPINQFSEEELQALENGELVPVEEPNDKPADKPADQQADQPTDKPADQPTDKPADQPTDKPADKPAELKSQPPAFSKAIETPRKVTLKILREEIETLLADDKFGKNRHALGIATELSLYLAGHTRIVGLRHWLLGTRTLGGVPVPQYTADEIKAMREETEAKQSSDISEDSATVE